MTLHLLAAELAAAVPELQRDSIVNNEKYFEGRLRELLDSFEENRLGRSDYICIKCGLRQEKKQGDVVSPF